MPKALVIEDNKLNLQLVSYLLRRQGFDVQEATSGQEALQWLEHNMADVILLDIQLPHMDGTKILQHLRTNDRTRHIIVIALTAYAMPGDREHFEQLGFNGYIAKPIDPHNFVSQVTRYLQTG
jgi:CheY-like chemotaxis protein